MNLGYFSNLYFVAQKVLTESATCTFIAAFIFEKKMNVY